MEFPILEHHIYTRLLFPNRLEMKKGISGIKTLAYTSKRDGVISQKPTFSFESVGCNCKLPTLML